MDEIEDIKHRHNTLKNYLENRNWDKNPSGKLIEFDLIRDVAKNLHRKKPLLKDFIYIYDYEWELIPGRSDQGKGDLIFTDGKSDYLIVECKLRGSNYVRQQVERRINDFKIIKPYLNKICGLAVSRNDWDYLDENGKWDFGESNEYFRTYDNIPLSLDQLDAKSKFQESYKKIGYKPKDPISALNELDQQNFLDLSDNFDLLENKPPFLVKIKAKLNKIFIKDFEGKGEALNKREARALASANICEQIFLEYDMSDLKIPIDEIERGEVYRLKKR